MNQRVRKTSLLFLALGGGVALSVFLFRNFRHTVNGASLHRGRAKRHLLLSELPASKPERRTSAVFLSLVAVFR